MSAVISRITTGLLAVTLTAAGMVATTGPTATAASGSTTYTCDLGALGELPVPVGTSIPDFPIELPAGTPAGSYDADFVLGVAPALATQLGTGPGGSLDGFELSLGGTAVPVHGFGLGALEGVPGSQTMSGSSSTDTFALPEPGTYELLMPESFTFLGSAPCVTDAPALLGTLTVLPGAGPALSESTTEATLAKKRILKGKKAKVTATVTLSPIPAPGTGDVVVKKRKKTIGTGTLDSGGSVTIRTRAFKKPGRYTLKVKYLGEPPLIAGSKDTVVLRVKRRR